jgi:hypothetical protein
VHVAGAGAGAGAVRRHQDGQYTGPGPRRNLLVLRKASHAAAREDAVCIVCTAVSARLLPVALDLFLLARLASLRPCQHSAVARPRGLARTYNGNAPAFDALFAGVLHVMWAVCAKGGTMRAGAHRRTLSIIRSTLLTAPGHRCGVAGYCTCGVQRVAGSGFRASPRSANQTARLCTHIDRPTASTALSPITRTFLIHYHHALHCPLNPLPQPL